jgi:diaminopimelate epimerase
MHLPFTKMHGLGNDFVVISAMDRPVDLSAEKIRMLADRQFGVGCDQVLLVEPARSREAQFRYRIFNADGSEVEQCGNGARCFARFVYDKGLTNSHAIPVETHTGLIILHLENNGEVTVNMGPPRFEPAALPFKAATPALSYDIEVEGERVPIGAVSMGNPHAVLIVNNVDTAPVAWLGPRIERHERFPRRVNVGFMQIVDRAHFRLRVFERGVGETLACGTGACAAMAVGRSRGLLDGTARAELPGGTLTIHWNQGEDPVMMTGPATTVFEGHIEL